MQTKLYNEIVKEFSDGIDYERLTQNEYLDAVVLESLRLGASILLQTRTASQNVKLGDIEVEKGTEIRLINYIGHMNSDYYLDPRTFNPDRFLKSSNQSKGDSLFIPFGSGPKICLGQRLAILEIKYLFVSLLKKYEIYKAKDAGIKRTTFRGFISTDKLNVAFRLRR